MSKNLDRISEAFVGARLEGRPLASYPGTLPSSLDDAYRVQDRSIERWPDLVAGWKIGLVPSQFRRQVGAERLVGPIFADRVTEYVAGRLHNMPVFEGGFAAVEAEFVFRLQRDVPTSVIVNAELVRDVVGAMFVGVEIASSPFKGINELGPICVVTDFGNNHGLILGPEIHDWEGLQWKDIPATVTIDGEVVGQADAAAIPGGPLEAVGFIIGLMRERNIPLKAGALISTGAVTGVHEAKIGSFSRVDFGPYGRIELMLSKFAGIAANDESRVVKPVD